MMKKANIVLGGLLLLASLAGSAQGKFYTKTGRISFFSSTPLEDIDAINRSVVGVLDTKTGDLQFAALMKGFEFRKALMQEHFNADYAESTKYPKAEFKGQITNNGEINYTTNGSFAAKVKGKLTIHGVTRDIETSGTITVKDGKLTLASTFNVLVADYNITIEKLYRDNIAKTIKVTVDCTLSPL
ncbi:MAG TPA: YceI family protein [Chitinophagaceae bacterium]|nr:YceI family protein [Chitinophagaceae bacterium]